MDILKTQQKQMIVERDKLLDDLDIKYNLYSIKLSHQKTLIRRMIQQQYDQQIDHIQQLLLISFTKQLLYISNQAPNEISDINIETKLN